MATKNAKVTAAASETKKGYSAAKGARAAARKVLGAEAVEGTEFKLVELDGGRFDWEPIEQKRNKGRKSEKGAPVAKPKAEAQQFAPIEDNEFMRMLNLNRNNTLPESQRAHFEWEIERRKTAASEMLAGKGASMQEQGEAEAAEALAAKGEHVSPGARAEDAPNAAASETVKLKDVEEIAEAVVSKAASAFGAFAQQQLGIASSGRRIGDTTGGRRETDNKSPEAGATAATPNKRVKEQNEIQNGVRKPTTGTLCRAVWDALDAHLSSAGEQPSSKDVKTLAEANNWNPTNASIEFYQWRKFNGIRGRQNKAAPKAPAAPRKPAAKPIA